MKRFERSNGLDTALYKNYLYTSPPVQLGFSGKHSRLAAITCEDYSLILENENAQTSKCWQRGFASYEGVHFNVISIARGYVGVKILGKKRYIPLEWSLCEK